ncbi:nuclear transport factor 2 family protein [Mycobacteroides abscessus]|uniref:nuclear transport factor 2 family protein n=1 Tax=Mycobacteroides abscessus TaxID=36809 RepID=UPI0009A6FB26|nr:nuclear transport factor 2 family protein [Mycobacteroides abscessus]RIT49501.1 nuclear transport factor 2 family protein [Mycobacteroides abscessus]SKU02580.1 Steroid Delta-isomerase [Mycobacteroides abscessus subsp. massiliense]SKU11830.1 Steroid Delta-isomerase [Mycobacteroides abscessus subsp. massiliense]
MAEHALTVSEAKVIIDRLARAKSAQNIDAAMEIYHPDAVLESPPLGTHYVGEQVRGAIAGWFAFAPDYQVEIAGNALDQETLCSWGTITFTPAFTAGGQVPNGKKVSVPAFMLFQFRGGRVSWESFHFDIASTAQQCGVNATALVKQ